MKLQVFILLWGLNASFGQTNLDLNYESESLKIVKISEHTFIHISYLQTQSFGKVECNGLIFLNKSKAIIFDTPTDNIVSNELIDFLAKQNITTKAVVINHFHDDCLGGLEAFHKRNIISYANQETLKQLLAKENVTYYGKSKVEREQLKNKSLVLPKKVFKNHQNIKLGNKKILNYYPGKAHTIDNIVSYIPSEQVLFGGCMVKSVNATKGNLADADTIAWPQTIHNVKNKFKKVKWVVPGHGSHGDSLLLDYTIQLFSEK
jgi:metallo-beta-lactamase class B